jgi:ribose transport system ATP-binding protein
MTRDVSLDLFRGDILGLTGLAGTGFEEVPYLLYGAQPCQARRIVLNGLDTPAAKLSPAHSIRAGIIFIPGNRLRDGAVGTLPVGDNVALPVLKSFTGRWGLRLRQLADATREVLRVFDVRPADPERLMGKLSGGNQQKAVLAKWLQTRPTIMLMHEPTQGVDVGARKQIFAQIRASADRGTAVLIASGEYEDLAHVCDRVLVFRDGAVAAELAGTALTADALADAVLKTARTVPQETAPSSVVEADDQ